MYPNLFAELVRRGWTERELAALAGGNVLRVLAEVEAAARGLQAEPPGRATLAP
jgi:membrane dipeptidase